MAIHKANAQFARARWRLRLLIPIWTLQQSLIVAMMGLFAWRLGNTLKHFEELKKSGDLPTVEFVWEITNVAFSFVAALCTFFEIGKYIAESLTPWTMLFTHVLKLSCATAILALDVVVYARQHDKHYSLIGLGLDIAFILVAATLAVYAAIVYHRLSTADDYAHPANVKPYGFSDGLEPSNSYTGLIAAGRSSIDKTMSWHASPRRSFSSFREESVPMQRVDRSPSTYSHQRDTSFDDYVARRGSIQSVQSDSDKQAALLAAGFNCYSPSVDGKLNIPTVTVTDMTHSRARSLSLGQSPIYRSDHVLVAVPEEDEPTAALRTQDESHEALLGRQEVDETHNKRPGGGHARNRSVSYESSLNIDSKRSPKAAYGSRDSIDYPQLPQEVDVTETRWAPARV
ncbi:hypothetical protein HJFPF1_12808 [Paramyrothecium foliicola]|nr:hypothetical protein HJFPF1_12808 [Paramyrothecium foliicola]